MASPRRPPESLSWKRRLLAVSIVALGHIVVLAALIATHRPETVQTESREGALTLASIDLFAPPSPVAVTTPQPQPVKAVDAAPATAVDPADIEPIAHPEDLGLPAPRTDIEPEPLTPPPPPTSMAAPADAPMDPCHLADTLRVSLQEDGRVPIALALIPRASRSVANAIMFWDGQWVTVNSLGGEAGVEPIRQAIVAGLLAESADCQDRLNTGPIVIPFVDPRGTTLVVLGSGPWRAADLIAQPTGVR